MNNSLIYTSITGFPSGSEELKDKSAFDLTIQAMTGFMHITGEKEGPPTKVGYAITDILTGHHATQGILAALLQRQFSRNMND